MHVGNSVHSALSKYGKSSCLSALYNLFWNLLLDTSAPPIPFHVKHIFTLSKSVQFAKTINDIEIICYESEFFIDHLTAEKIYWNLIMNLECIFKNSGSYILDSKGYFLSDVISLFFRNDRKMH